MAGIRSHHFGPAFLIRKVGLAKGGEVVAVHRQVRHRLWPPVLVGLPTVSTRVSPILTLKKRSVDLTAYRRLAQGYFQGPPAATAEGPRLVGRRIPGNIAPAALNASLNAVSQVDEQRRESTRKRDWLRAVSGEVAAAHGLCELLSTELNAYGCWMYAPDEGSFPGLSRRWPREP